MKYNIGQILTLKEDLETEGCFGTKKIRKVGTKLFVKADKDLPQVTYLNGDIQCLPKDAEIDGYSVNGIAEWLYLWLRNRYELDDFLDDYEIEKEDFKEEIANALEELDMWDNTGNRS